MLSEAYDYVSFVIMAIIESIKCRAMVDLTKPRAGRDRVEGFSRMDNELN